MELVTKTKRLSVFTLLFFGMITIFAGVFPNLASPNFSFYEFSRGMLTGLSGLAAVRWMILLVKVIIKETRSLMKIFSEPVDMNAVLCIGMSLMFSGLTLTSIFPATDLLLRIGFILIGLSIVFNAVYFGRFIRVKQI